MAELNSQDNFGTTLPGLEEAAREVSLLPGGSGASKRDSRSVVERIATTVNHIDTAVSAVAEQALGVCAIWDESTLWWSMAAERARVAGAGQWNVLATGATEDAVVHARAAARRAEEAERNLRSSVGALAGFLERAEEAQKAAGAVDTVTRKRSSSLHTGLARALDPLTEARAANQTVAAETTSIPWVALIEMIDITTTVPDLPEEPTGLRRVLRR